MIKKKIEGSRYVSYPFMMMINEKEKQLFISLLKKSVDKKIYNNKNEIEKKYLK